MAGWGRATWGTGPWGQPAGVSVDVTGQSLTSAVGSPLIISWSNVDPGVTNTWTEVDIAA